MTIHLLSLLRHSVPLFLLILLPCHGFGSFPPQSASNILSKKNDVFKSKRHPTTLFLLKNKKLEETSSSTVVSQTPRKLRGNYKKHRPEIAQYLGDMLRLSDDEKCRLLAHFVPQDRTMEEVQGLFNFLEDRLGLKPKDIRRMMGNKYGILLTCTVENNFDPIVSWLKKDLGFDETQMRKVLVRMPSILRYNIENNLKPTVCWLKNDVGFDDSQVQKVVVRMPPILGLSIETNLKPTVEWLKHSLGFDDAEVRKLLVRSPAIFGSSIEKKLKPTVKWLNGDLGLDKTQIRRILLMAPSTLGLSIETNLKPTVEWLKNDLGFDDSQVRRMLVRMPPLWSLSIEKNLKPTLMFYEDCVGIEDALSTILVNPNMLCYSLDLRLKPRLADVKQLGIEMNTGTISRMAMYTELKWKTSLAYHARIGE